MTTSTGTTRTQSVRRWRWLSAALLPLLLLSACGGTAPATTTDSGTVQSAATTPASVATTAATSAAAVTPVATTAATSDTTTTPAATAAAATTPAQTQASAAQTAASAGSNAPVTLTFWTHTHPPMVDENKKIIAEYQQQHPNVKIDYQIIPNNNFGDKMLTALSTGTGPDIINMDDNAMRSIYIPKGLITEVDPKALGYTSSDDVKNAYVEGALEGASLNGKVYGVPSEFNVTAFAINTAAFQEVGLDPNNPPKTWDEVGTMGQKLVKKEGDQVTRRGFDFLYLHAGWYHNQFGTLLQQTGGTLTSPDGKTTTVNKPEAVKALQIWYDMINKYKIADPKIASREATVPYQDFLDGKVAMTLLNPWGMGLVTDKSAVYQKYKIVPLPQVDVSKPAAPFYAYYWAVPAASKNKEEAFKFISYLSSKPGEWLKNVNFIQPKKGWTNLPEAKDFPFGAVWGEQMKVGHFLPIVPNASEVDKLMKDAIESSVLSNTAPQQALDQAAAQIQPVLTK